jgi:hypothetical protein
MPDQKEDGLPDPSVSRSIGIVAAAIAHAGCATSATHLIAEAMMIDHYIQTGQLEVYRTYQEAADKDAPTGRKPFIMKDERPGRRSMPSSANE